MTVRKRQFVTTFVFCATNAANSEWDPIPWPPDMMLRGQSVEQAVGPASKTQAELDLWSNGSKFDKINRAEIILITVVFCMIFMEML